jgi:hypothetical protein
LADVTVTVKSVDQGSGNITSFGQKLNGLIGTAKNVTVALAAVGATAKQAFDLSKEGANLNQLTESFERMNQTVFQTPDLLNQMRTAVNGTIKDTDLMKGVLTLTAGTTGDYAQTLASITPQLLEIAKASNKLNPALGETSFLYDSVAIGIKRQSPLILDNLGLTIKMENAVKQVHPALQNLATDYSQLNEQQRFLNEVMWQGDNLLQQVGGTVVSQADSWAKLETQIATITDNFKRFLADGLAPTMDALSGTNADAVEEMIGGNLEAAKSIEQLVTEAQKLDSVRNIWGGLGAAITGAEGEINTGIQETVRLMATQSGSFEEFSAAIEAGFGRRSQLYIDEFIRRLGMTKEAFFVMANASDLSMDRSREAMSQFTATIAENQAAVQNVKTTTVPYNMTLQELALSERELTYTTNMSVEAGREAAAAFTEQRFSASEAAARINELNQRTREAAAAQGMLFQTITDTEPAMRLLMENTGALSSGLGGVVVNEDALTDIYMEQAQNLGFSAEQTAALMVARGEMTKEAANVILQEIAIRQEAENLMIQFQKGTLTMDQVNESMTKFVANLTDTGSAASETADKLTNLREMIDNLPTEKRITIRGDVEVPELPWPFNGGESNKENAGPGGKAGKAGGGRVGWEGTYQVGEGNKPELFQGDMGGLFMIPGQNGRIVPFNEFQGGGSGAPLVGQLTINVGETALKNPEQAATQLAAKFMSIIGGKTG